MLDEKGTLSLARPNPERFERIARFKLTTRRTWAPAALSGTVLYVRVDRDLKALDLGAPRARAGD